MDLAAALKSLKAHLARPGSPGAAANPGEASRFTLRARPRSPNAAFVVATVLGFGGQSLLDLEWFVAGATCFAVAAGLFAWAARSVAPQASFHVANRWVDLDPGRRLIGFGGIAIAILASLAAAFLFAGRSASQVGWWSYLLSVVLLAAATFWMTVRPQVDLRGRLLRRRGVTIALLLIVAFGASLRLYALSDLPFGVWYDEAESGLAARRLLSEPDFRVPFIATMNTTVFLPALFAAATTVFGDSIAALRSVSAIFGIGAIVAAFLVGRELHGLRFGLVLAFVTAAARWHINFSRVAMTGVDTPFFEFVATYFLLRMINRGRLRDAFFAGLAVGSGLLFYQAYRLFVVGLLVFAVISAARAHQSLTAHWRLHLQQVGMLVLTVIVVTMPVLQFAWRSPDVVLNRVSETSILPRREEPNLARALLANTTRHLLMFNVAGDRNGRHNLPGEPILDPAMGVLAVLGFVAALSRGLAPANLFFLVLFGVGLAGGILTVDFEAPQSLRSIAAFPAVAYFIALAATALARYRPAAGRAHRGWRPAAAIAITFYIAAVNTHEYFGRFGANGVVWSSFSAAETVVGRELASRRVDEVAVLSELLANHPTIRYLAPAARPQVLQVPDAFPIRDGSGRPVVIFFSADERALAEEGHRLYPGATFAALAGPPPFDETPHAYMLALQMSDLTSVRGLDVLYTPVRREREDQVPVQRRTHAVAADWLRGTPLPGAFTAEWSGILHVSQHGVHHMRITSPASSYVEIDGTRVMEGHQGSDVRLTLAQGNHQIRVWAEGGPGQVRLMWTPPGQTEQEIPPASLYQSAAGGGLLAALYDNGDWRGPPVMLRIDPVIDTYFHVLPLRRPYSVEWRGSLDVPVNGSYRVGLRAVQEASLELDGQVVLATETPDVMTEAVIPLRAGSRKLRLRYRDTTERSRLHFWWAPPGAPFQRVPREALLPPQGDEARALLRPTR